MKIQNSFICLAVAALSISPALAAGKLNIPNEPLTVLSSRVDPNVMLLIDNSGSMNNVIWFEGDDTYDGYDPNTSYQRWDNRIWVGGNYSYEGSEWDVNGQNIHLSSLTRDNCSSGYTEAVRINDWRERKCIKLPRPEGNSTRFTGNYLNYIFATFPHNTDLTTYPGFPNETRMKVARDVSSEIVREVEGVRFGAARFYSSAGGKIIQGCGPSQITPSSAQWASHKDDLIDEISDLDASTNTPISEAYYEVTRYFRGLEGVWSGTPQFTSPIQYRCQKNFSILITDGEPTQDGFEGVWNTVTNDKISGINKTLPDWNNDSGDYYLDDIAEFAWELDLKPNGNEKDKAGVSYNDPNFEKQNLYTYTVGFALDHSLLSDTATAGNGQYYTASTADELKDRLTQALSDIGDKVLSSSSAAASSGTLIDAELFFPQYNSLNWTGDLIKEDSSGSEVWVASAEMPSWNSRSIIYNKNGTGTKFRWGQLSQSLRDHLGGQSVLQYIRGNQDNEGNAGGEYRIRSKRLGDIIYSSPRFVGAPSFRYPADLESASYSSFSSTWANRDEMVYVGANDGMLHAFDADTGEEKLAFIPDAALENLPSLASQTYDHKYFVDGTPTIVDAFVDNQWKSILVGGLNKGGQSVYALDVTDPSKFNEGNASDIFMWEFTDADLGYTYSRPAIVKLHNGTWAAIFGNGYNNTVPTSASDTQVSSTGNAVLYIVDLSDGSLIGKIDTGIGSDDDPTGGQRPNGLGTLAPVDHDLDSVVDYVYAGDLFGNVWKFDLSGDSNGSGKGKGKNNGGGQNSMNMEVAFGGNPLFTACYGSGNSCTRQPIMVAPNAAPTVGRHPKGGFLVYFGTGKYIETEDKTAGSDDIQTFYAIWDKNEGGNQTPVSGRSQLLKQTIAYEGEQSFDGANSLVRLVSSNEPNWSSHKGWYMDFNKLTSARERIVTTPTLRNGKVIFPTTIPLIQSDPCRSDSESWLMDLDAITGGALDYSAFDLNEDGKFNVSDEVAGDSGGVVSGIKFSQELPAPTILADDETSEEKVLTRTVRLAENPGPGREGRQSWLEAN